MANKRLPAGTSFKQQRLRACTPILTPAPVIATFFMIGVIFLPIGIVLLLESDDVSFHASDTILLYAKNYVEIFISLSNPTSQIVEVSARYDRACPVNETLCAVNITLRKEMKRPVYFYYGLTNYNQNHRRYVKSRSDIQLRGDRIDSVGCVNCCDFG